MFYSSLLKKNIDSLAAAIAGFIIIFLFTRHGGIGVCPDAVVYTTTAENFHSHGSLRDFTNNPLVNFPPLYPIFLSALMALTGLKPLLFAPYLNALLFAAVIYVAGVIMEQFSFPSRWYKSAVLTCIVLSPALLEVYSMVWSETIFILLLLFFMIAMHQYFQGYSRKLLITAAVIGALAGVTRYAGITIIVSGGIFLLLDMQLSSRQKLKNLLLYLLISPSLLIISLVRNYIVSKTNTGMREKSLTSLHENIRDAGSVFNDWLPFLHGHYNGAAWTAALLIAALIALSIRYFIKDRRFACYQSMAVVFSLVYILFMIIIASVSRFETLNSRFFSPVFIFLLWSCSNWIISLFPRVNSPGKKWITVTAMLSFLMFQYGQFDADYETWDGVKDAGIPGYTEDQWKYSPTVNFIEKNPVLFQNGSTVYSNAYDAVYFFTHEPGKFLPHREFKPGIQKFLMDSHCYVVWFDDGDDPDLVGMDFIKHVKKMKLLKQFDDGAVYEYDSNNNNNSAF